ncbi:MAG: chalcone isomerase family protein [Pseudomonadota bacterium]
MKRRLIACLIPLLFSLPVTAAEEQWQLVGEARLKVLFWSVYDSSLFSEDGRYTEGQRPLRLEIKYLRDIEASDLLENTQSEWEGLPGVPAASGEWLQDLALIWPDVKANDVLAFEVNSEGAGEFFLNGESLGGIDDSEFSGYFLDIWLSPDTSRPKLRQGLIGGG